MNGKPQYKTPIVEELDARGGSAATIGCALYAALCQQLIDDGENYLYAEIGRTRQTDWIAIIAKHQDHPKETRLALGQADTMDAACDACVKDYHHRQQIAARKEELLKDPNVREALQLYGHNEKVERLP